MNSASTDYLSNINNDFAAVEERHFWYRIRTEAITNFLKSYFLPKCSKNPRILEVGCGTGRMMKTLRQFGNEVVGIEPHYPGTLEDASRQGILKLGLAEALPKFQEKFDLACAFDVFEHVENDRDFLRGIKSSLKKGGTVLITVPAMKALWSSFDEFDLHYRRYEYRDLQDLLEKEGFELVKMSYLFFATTPLVLLVRRWREWRGFPPSAQNQDVLKPPGRVTTLFLMMILRLEIFWIMNVGRLPCGSSLIAIARLTEE